MKTKLFFLIICFGFLLPWTGKWVEAKNNKLSKLISIYKDDLSASERELFKKTEIGTQANYCDQLRSERTIRADRIVWLCTDRHASEIITYRGIQIRGEYIDGNLDLRYAKIPFPLCFVDCNFSMEINLEYANVLALDLSGSTTNKIIANGLEVYYSLFLNNKFRSRHKVSLDGAKIGGDLDCGNATFNDPNEALIADGLWVGHKIIMNNNFESKGKVRFNGATIGIALDCSNGKFSDFIANGLKIERSIYMPNGINMKNMFVADGMVSLIDGTIGGIVDCRGAKFKHPNGDTNCHYRLDFIFYRR